VQGLAVMTEKLAFFSGMRLRAHAFVPKSSGKPSAMIPSLDGGTARVLRIRATLACAVTEPRDCVMLVRLPRRWK
jgi:hypothetical protein